jgi:hypothetical protein
MPPMPTDRDLRPFDDDAVSAAGARTPRLVG